MLIVILIFSLCSCSSKITQGEVYEKEFKPAETQTMMIPTVHTNGRFTYTTYVTYFYDYPDRYIIKIRKLGDDKKYKTAEYYVTKSVFDEINIGDEFVYELNRDYSEEPYTRTRKR